VPSFAIGVVRNREVVWEEGVGWADRESKTPATSETLYPIASVSKSITATGTLALVLGGKLRLGQAAESILGDARHPGMRGSLDSVLVSHLLAHTSGIPHVWHYEYPDRPETVVGRARLIKNNTFVAAPPGERFLYSNLGYGVLAELIERVGGAPFQRVMERSLFGPLGMSHTTIDTWVAADGVVRGYTSDGAAIPYRYRLAPDGGAGFFSNVHDLLRYAQFHLGALEHAVPAREAAITAALGTLPPEGRFHYLRGWGVVHLPEATVLISDGEVAGGTAVVLVVPERQLAVVVLCNATGGPALQAAVAILSGLIPAFDEQFGAAVGSVESELSAPGVSPTGRFEGFLFDGADSLAMSVDFSDPAAPVLQLGESIYLLQGVSWDRGALQATAVGSLPVGAGKGRTHRLTLTLWPRGDDLRGVAQEDLADDRPGFGIPHLLVLRSAKS
jgi:CubicO group peptidase (beta-lactamase class C family)